RRTVGRQTSPTSTRRRPARFTSGRRRWPRPTKRASRSASKLSGLTRKRGKRRAAMPSPPFVYLARELQNAALPMPGRARPMIVSVCTLMTCRCRHAPCLSDHRCDLPREKIPKGDGQMNRKGFTRIVLLIVVVIIGILAAIAVPKLANKKEKAYLASMRQD